MRHDVVGRDDRACPAAVAIHEIVQFGQCTRSRLVPKRRAFRVQSAERAMRLLAPPAAARGLEDQMGRRGWRAGIVLPEVVVEIDEGHCVQIELARSQKRAAEVAAGDHAGDRVSGVAARDAAHEPGKRVVRFTAADRVDEREVPQQRAAHVTFGIRAAEHDQRGGVLLLEPTRRASAATCCWNIVLKPTTW
jgi:hypothetical protein